VERSESEQYLYGAQRSERIEGSFQLRFWMCAPSLAHNHIADLFHSIATTEVKKSFRSDYPTPPFAVCSIKNLDLNSL
jgi:hypothetical protein